MLCVPGVYGGQVSLLVLTSLQSLLRPAMASTHQEGTAVGQVGSGGAVTEAAVSKSGDGVFVIHRNKHVLSLQKPPPVLDVQGPGLLVNNPGPGGGAEQQQQGGGEAGHYGLVGGAVHTDLT